MSGEDDLDRAVAEWHAALEAGLAPSREEWLARHPGLAAYFAALDAAEPALGPLRAVLVGMPTIGWPVPDGETPQPVRIGDYAVLRELGRGGMGVVYEARHRGLGRRVALKTMLSGELRWLQREAETCALLDHPGIVSVYEAGCHEGMPWFAMRLVDGPSLADRLPEFVSDPEAAARLAAKVARAVHHAHERGVLHRDLKPANVLLDAGGEPCVTDFGLARRVEDPALSQAGAILGTPVYMAPEQLEGGQAATTATDVHGLGALLYALLSGQPPFAGQNLLETLDRVRNAQPEPPSRLNPRVPPDLETVCLKCLEKAPGRRYPSALALAQDLERHLAGEGVQARPVGWAERAWRWARRSPARAVGVGLAFALVALLSLYWRGYAQTRARHKEAALALARSADERFRLVGHAVRITARRPELRRMLAIPQEKARRAALQAFLGSTRAGFNQWFTWATDEPLVNWFVLDHKGVIVADSLEGSPAVGGLWRQRDYARLLDEDGGDEADVAMPFHSRQDDLFKFAFVVRILDAGRSVGLLAASVPVAARMLGLDMADHPPGAVVACLLDRTYPAPGEGPTVGSRWIAALSLAHAEPGRRPIWEDGEAGRLLDRFLSDRSLAVASAQEAGQALDAARVGRTRHIALVRHPLPWPAGLLPAWGWPALAVAAAAAVLAIRFTVMEKHR